MSLRPRRYVWAMSMATACIVMLACGSAPNARDTEKKPAAAVPSPGQEQRFDLKGKVVAVDKSQKKLTVAHEAIPGFMAGMTMTYTVKDDSGLDAVSPGEQVSAKVVSRGTDYWLEDVRPTANAPSK